MLAAFPLSLIAGGGFLSGFSGKPYLQRSFFFFFSEPCVLLAGATRLHHPFDLFPFYYAPDFVADEENFTSFLRSPWCEHLSSEDDCFYPKNSPSFDFPKSTFILLIFA